VTYYQAKEKAEYASKYGDLTEYERCLYEIIEFQKRQIDLLTRKLNKLESKSICKCL
jgi:hypothetical protein